MNDFLDLDFGSKKTKKDKRRSFTKKQKELVYKAQNGRCGKCRKKFPLSELEGAHKTRSHADGGLTVAENCSLFCPTCHSRVDKVKNKKRKKTKKSKRKGLKFKTIGSFLELKLPTKKQMEKWKL